VRTWFGLATVVLSDPWSSSPLPLVVVDAERDVPGASITTFSDTARWALTTITTVGPGDQSRVTSEATWWRRVDDRRHRRIQRGARFAPCACSWPGRAAGAAAAIGALADASSRVPRSSGESFTDGSGRVG
jgi:hypothetical protein